MTLQLAVLHRAANIVGGIDALSARLRLNRGVMQYWREGRGKMPEEVFLQLVDIVLKDDVARSRADRRQYTRSVAFPDKTSCPT
jgi:hypothetical protein